MPGVADIFRRVIGRISGYSNEDSYADAASGVQGDGISYDDVLAQLHMVKEEIDRAKIRLQEEIINYHERLKSSLKNNDHESVIISASELALKKKVYKAVATYSSLLSLAIERIRDTRNLETIAKTIASVSYAMQHMSEYLGTITPEVSASLLAAAEHTESVIRKAGLLGSIVSDVKSVSMLDQEARQLIAEAAKEAAEETERVTPAVPESFDPTALETRLIEYIRASGGVVKISKAAESLGVPPGVIRELLARLEAKGFIKVERVGTYVQGA